MGKLFSIIMLILVCLTSCSDESKSGPEKIIAPESGISTGKYFPLAVGNHWEFTLRVGSHQTEMISNILRIEKAENKDWFVFQLRVADRDSLLLRYEDGNLYQSGKGIILKNDLKLNDEWIDIVENHQSYSATYSHKVIGIYDKYVSENKEYSSVIALSELKKTIIDNELIQYHTVAYYAAGIGPFREEAPASDAVSVLNKFEIK